MREKILIVVSGALAGAAMMQALYIVRGRKGSQNFTAMFKDTLKTATDIKTKVENIRSPAT